MNETSKHEDEEPQIEPSPENSVPTLENKEELGSKEAIEEVKNWVKKTVQEWHDKVNPDYIFVTETAGVPYGYVLKKTWENAYPDEECPDFYRIDPGATRERTDDWVEKDERKDKGIKKYFQKRIKKDNAKIIVFDEGGGDFIENSFSRAGSIGRTAIEIRDAYRDFIDKKEGEIWIAHGAPEKSGEEFILGMIKSGNPGEPDYREIFKRPTSKLFGSRSSYRGESEDEKLINDSNRKKGEHTLVGGIVKHPGQRKRAIEFVKQLRKIGKEAGEELHIELEKEREE